MVAVSQESRVSFQMLDWKRHFADLSAALLASICVTPIVASVDKAVVQNAAGKVPLFASLFTSLRVSALSFLRICFENNIVTRLHVFFP